MNPFSLDAYICYRIVKIFILKEGVIENIYICVAPMSR